VTPTENNKKTPQAATGLFALLCGRLRAAGSGAPKPAMLVKAALVSLPALLASAGIAASLPPTAGAYATIEGPPTYSSAPGLPDNRVYEQVSPTDTNGNQAGASTLEGEEFVQLPGGRRYALASLDGDSVLFEGTGPLGETASPLSLFFVATRTSAGWHTHAIAPRPQQSIAEIRGALDASPVYIDPSPDLSHAMVGAPGYTLAPLPNEECREQIFLTGSDPFVAATWLEQPEVKDPVESCYPDSNGEAGAPVGGSPDFSTVYFTYPGTLLPEDASRALHAKPKTDEGGGEQEKIEADVEAWGFYEDRESALHEAGVLPDGKLDEFGAVPAVSGRGRALSGNEVSSDGSRAFFVSPDPGSCEQNPPPFQGENNCVLDPPELYVRENGEKTLLVSRDMLLPEADGLSAPAPRGVLSTSNPTQQEADYVTQFDGSYVFASPDGSQAFFQSADDLTQAAVEASPGSEPKTYDFDVNTGALTYLPDVTGRILATDTDGSAFAFLRPEAGGAPPELDLWSAGPNGGGVTPITQLPSGENVEPVRMSADGSVVVFTATGLTDFNDVGTSEIFRYDAQANTLGCVSCSPPGVAPSDASMSILREGEKRVDMTIGTVDERGISADGDRIFFQTQAPLVPRDTNTDTTSQSTRSSEAQGEDVYEWENGIVYLISSGKSPRDSFFLDNSESGDDVFFATTEALTPGHTDGGYAVYDARAIQSEESTPAAVPCEGSVCEGPPNVPSPLTPPASATFSGLGNPTPEPAAVPPPPKQTTTKTVKCTKGKKLNHGKCVKKVKSKETKATKPAKGSK
jgi:hypothetical protein